MLVIKNDKIIVDSPVLEIIIPAFYTERGMFLKQAGYYSLLFVVMARNYTSVEAYNKGSVKPKMVPLVYPYRISTHPSLIETDVMRVPEDAHEKAVIKLIYYKGDILSDSTNYIKLSDNTRDLYNMIDDGKGDFLPYLSIAEAMEVTHYMNDTKMPVPVEAIHTIVATRCMDPDDYQKNARFMKKLPSGIQSLNPRETMASGTVFGMFGFEDVNTALMISANREEKGIVDPATTIEKIILTAKA